MEEGHKIQISRLSQGCLIGFFITGIIAGSMRITVNSFVGLLVTFLPELLERDYDIAMSPWLVLWIVSAVFFHSVGTVGAYQQVWWWDHLAHTLSASVVAAAGYATLRAFDRHMEGLYIPRKFMFLYLLIFVMAFGVIWEVIEFLVTLATESTGSETVITQYGIEDTMMDLLFDALGAVVVALFGTAHLTHVSEDIRNNLRD